MCPSIVACIWHWFWYRVFKCFRLIYMKPKARSKIWGFSRTWTKGQSLFFFFARLRALPSASGYAGIHYTINIFLLLFWALIRTNDSYEAHKHLTHLCPIYCVTTRFGTLHVNTSRGRFFFWLICSLWTRQEVVWRLNGVKNFEHKINYGRV
jgi:hypothetical protein